ncbi:MAG: Hsp70 family protein [Acidobacteriaceae bacterium]|nr:Hsp70 family protein [Acidobacteriaceae bacterium]
MRLGVDFGTNRIVVAAADRGNYPLVSFEGAEGSTADWYPSLIALHGHERCYGWEAWQKQVDDAWTVVRSIKRLLEDAGPQTVLDIGEQQVPLNELLSGLASALHTALRQSSNLRVPAGAVLEIVLGVPAHANSNQRYLTIEAFRSAGFIVSGILNEPSAASIEFGHRQRQSKSSPETILVYDLGGGTFDASLVKLDENVHDVIASEGIPTIGGDDFDQILADLALEGAKVGQSVRDGLSAAAWFRLLEECRTKKESLNPNSRRIIIDLEHVDPSWESVQISVADFYDAARPLVEETMAATEDLLSRESDGQFEALYITGGGSELPLVARVLRERFGRRVRRSAYTRSATAIGLAIQASQPETYRLSERLARFFGVWRETDAGSRILFDPLFEKGMSLPAPGEKPLMLRRDYTPVHNIGHFRFFECSHRTEGGAPTGDISLWDEIRFPFEPALETEEDLTAVPVRRYGDSNGNGVEELYTCDSGGSISVTITNRASGHSRTYRLGRWSHQAKSVKPGRRGKRGS